MVRRRRYGFAKPHLLALFTVVDGLGSLVAALARALRPPKPPANPRRVLLVNFAHIGDLLMVTPALRGLRSACPEAHITVLVGPWSRDVLAACPYLDQLLVFPPSWWDRQNGAYLRRTEIARLVRLLREGQFDISINFKSFFQENLALWLARIPARVGYGIYGGGFFLTHQVEHDWNAHTVEKNVGLVSAALHGAWTTEGRGQIGGVSGRAGETPALPGPGLGAQASRLPAADVGRQADASEETGKRIRLSWDWSGQTVRDCQPSSPAKASTSWDRGAPAEASTSWDRGAPAVLPGGTAFCSRPPDVEALAGPTALASCQPEMFVFEEDVATASQFLRAALGAEEALPLFAFHIGAGYPSKLWGEERYAALASALAAKWGARILVVGAADDAPLVARMQELTRTRLIVAAGELTIRQMAALLARCRLFVGNDSGPAHIAAAIGLPAVAIFSGENEANVWRPYADNCQVIQRRPDCYPCGKRSCDRDHRCMADIPVEEVLAAVERILQSGGSSQ